MSEPVSALAGASYAGFATVAETGLRGMITLKGDLADAKLQAAVKKCTGVAVPDQRKITASAERRVAWMAPDELLITLPYAEVSKALAELTSALAGSHHLAVDVSDARAIFSIEGANAAEVLAKFCPVDIAALADGEIRRSRFAQVRAAVWRKGTGFELICFRSVADYVFKVLQAGARPGGEVGYF